MRLGAKSGTKVHIINIKNEYSLLELLFFRKFLFLIHVQRRTLRECDAVGLRLWQLGREDECIQTALVDECYAGFVGSALNRGSALVFAPLCS